LVGNNYGKQRRYGVREGCDQSGTILAKSVLARESSVCQRVSLLPPVVTQFSLISEGFLLALWPPVMVETAFSYYWQSFLRNKQSKTFSEVSVNSAPDGSRARWSQRY